MEIRRFLEKLSLGTPTPGGGSASALAGALSAALVAMTAGLSLKQGRLRKEEVEDIRKRALAIQKRLLRAVDEDAKSYEAVLKAFRLPKNTERGRLHRSRIIQKAYQEATATPQWVCQLSIQLLEYSKTLIFKGNPNAISDAGVAAFLADAALAGGLLNININLVPGTEKTFLKKMHSLMGRWEKKGNQLRGEIEKALHEIHGI
jgi:glutamate formiminotransferase/formiminotetrahydrofolate cyclodeaminase